MSKTLTIAIALASGFVGSLLTRYIAPPAAFAQNQTRRRTAGEIRAENFTLVDPSDRVVGTFISEPDRNHVRVTTDLNGRTVESFIPRRILLRDADGRVIWGAGSLGIQPLSER